MNPELVLKVNPYFMDLIMRGVRKLPHDEVHELVVELVKQRDAEVARLNAELEAQDAKEA